MLSREEIEDELREVFAKMSAAELQRELGGEWRELVEAELARRRDASLKTDVAEAEPAPAPVAPEPPPQTEAPPPELETAPLAQPAPPPTPVAPPAESWIARIVRFLRAIFRKKPR